jgi:two-component system sensor histidine kinase/response regulator
MYFLSSTSIRQKLQGIVMVACTVALLVAMATLTLYDRATFLRGKTEDLVASAQMIGSNSTAALAFGDQISGREILSGLHAKTHVERACIYDKEGRVFAKYSRDALGEASCPAAAQRSGEWIEGRSMVLFQPIRYKAETIGSIFIGSDLGDLDDRLIRFALIAFSVLIGSLAIAFVLSSRLQRVISGPIQELAHTAQSISSDENYTRRAAKCSDDEIGVLFDQFNGMLDRIEQRDAALRKAHDELELRVDERTRELQKEVLERKQAEVALENQRAFLNSLIENSPVAIVARDADHHVQMCNPAFENLFLYRQAEIVGRSLRELITNPETEDRSALRLEEPVHQVAKRLRSDGSEIDVEILAVPLTIAGKASGRLSLFQDVTERKRAEEAMQRAKEAAEAASRAKSEFLANMSHEIRTPMNGIMGMTELVLDTELDTEQRNYLNVAKVSADSLLSLINDILDYSKIEAGKLEVDSIDFNLGNCLGETMKTLSLRAHQKGLELAFEIDPHVPDGLIGDPGRLRQIVVNLVGNAVKFTEQGEVVLRVLPESRSSEAIELHFVVTDTGIGIAADKQTAIFEAFKQADGSMTRKYGGTGLGLTISSRLVELMGGRLWVESEPEKGSRFHFTARFALQKTASRIVVPRDPEALRGMRVLVVDDNATNRQILLKMLDNWHTQPMAVDSGANAIVALKEGNGIGRTFPLILLDAQMPEMDGFALAEAIKRNPEWRAATIMMLSSAGQRGDAMRCRELGVASYLTKPVQQGELLDAVLTALGTRTQKETQAPPPLVTRHSLKDTRRHLEVLLVEDNAVNQLVVLRLLEKHGHAVTVASNGKKALAALEERSYDLVLMDVQMPEMNGWEATQAIREKERRTGLHIPIVAMTAHAMKGDEEKCLAAGMDSYLTKPIRSQNLLLILDEITKKGSTEVAAQTAPIAPLAKVIDLEAVLERLEGDRELFEELAHVFRNECPRTIKEIRRSFGQRDAAAVADHAHALKGSSANVGASAVSKTAFEIEKLARAGDLTRAGELLNPLDRDVDRVFCELEAFCTRS